jgi:hypothetical protein
MSRADIDSAGSALRIEWTTTTSVTGEGVAELQKALPKCEIIR